MITTPEYDALLVIARFHSSDSLDHCLRIWREGILRIDDRFLLRCESLDTSPLMLFHKLISEYDARKDRRSLLVRSQLIISIIQGRLVIPSNVLG